MKRVRVQAVRGVFCVCLTVMAVLWWSFPKRKTIDEQFLVLTVATEETSGLRRFIRSATVNRLPFKVLGLGQQWQGYGQKLLMLKEELKQLKHKNEIILYADAYDVLFNAGAEQIVQKFATFNASILFSAEKNCWPHQSLASLYPPVENGLRFLNAGAFIGYANDLYRMLSSFTISEDDDDQLFLTRIYLDEEQRRRFNIKLDHRCAIFQNLFEALADVQLRFNGQLSYAENVAFNSAPFIIHANGQTVFYLESLSNYIPKAWNPIDGCLACLENTRNFSNVQAYELPVVILAIFLEKYTSNVQDFFLKIEALDYPKWRMHLFVHNAVDRHSDLVNVFVEKHKTEYNSSKVILPGEKFEERDARELGLQFCIEKNCDFYFNVDSAAHLDNPMSLRLLMEQNRPVIAPLLARLDKSRANFWNSLPNEGLSSLDYTDIVSNDRRGLWSVAYITTCYLITGDVIRNPKTRPTYVSSKYRSPELAFCVSLRNNDVDAFVSNRVDFGQLSDVMKFGN